MFYLYYRMADGLHITGGKTGLPVWRKFLKCIHNREVLKTWFTYERKKWET